MAATAVGVVAGQVGAVAVPVVHVAGQVGAVAAPAVHVVALLGAAVAVAHKARGLLRLEHLRQEDRQMPVSKKAVYVVRPAQDVPEADDAGVRLRVTLVKSGTGYKYDQKRTLVALGLTKLNMTVEQPDNASIRGMLSKVQHLVRVEEIGQA